MSRYSLTHLADRKLELNLRTLAARDRIITAALLAHLAEFDARKLYLPAGYPSMYAWCVGELRMSEQAAFKRIRAARVARRFPAILGAVADGRLNVSAIVLLAPHLTRENAAELLEAAANRSQGQLEGLLAGRFPRPDLPTLLQPVTTRAPGEVTTDEVEQHETKLSSRTVGASTLGLAQERVEAMAHRARVQPLSARRFALQVTLAQATHDKLRRAQELLGHGPCAHAALGDWRRALPCDAHAKLRHACLASCSAR